MPKQTPLKIRTHAFKLFSEGATIPEIVSGLSEKYGDDGVVSEPTVYSWKRRYNWDDRKDQVEEKALAKVEESQVAKIAADDLKQKAMYERMANKAAEELENMTFQRPGDAVKAIDIGIQGQRGIAKGLVNIQFVEQVLAILNEEIADDDLWNRLQIRFAALMQNDG